MKLLVCGDRNWTDRLIIKEYLEYLKPYLVIEGGARGADWIAGEVARELCIPVKEIMADWASYGRAAGVIRNKWMLDEDPDLVLAFHHHIEESKGTADMLTKTEKRGIPYILVGIENQEEVI